MPPIVIHFRMAYDGGAVVDQALSRSFGDAWSAFGAPMGQGLGETDLREFLARSPATRAVSAYGLTPVLPTGMPCVAIAVLRHPLDRLLSVWESWSSEGEGPAGLDLAAGLRGFCAWILRGSPETLLVRDAQCLRFSPEASSRGLHGQPRQAATHADLAAAKTFLDALSVVGVADRMAATMQALASAVEPEPGCRLFVPEAAEPARAAAAAAQVRERIERFSSEVGTVLLHAINEENALDLALYEHACARLAGATASTGAGDALVVTGERFIPEASGFGPDTAAEHLLRYRAAAPLVAGKKVLDVASGEGYGTAILAAAASSVDGVDISPAAVQHAGAAYAGVANCRFHVGEAAHLPFPDASYDAVVSFETIEHVDEPTQRAFIAEIHRVLRPDGILVISSPNRVNYSERRGVPNHFHLREMNESEFRAILYPFRLFRFYRQGIMAFPAIWDPEREDFVLHGGLRHHEVDDLFFVAVCGRERALEPAASLNALWYDARLSYTVLQDTLLEKERLIQTTSTWAQGLQRTSVELQAEVERLRAQCAAAMRDGDPGELKAAEALLAERTARVKELGDWNERLQRLVDERDADLRALAGQVERLSATMRDEHAQRLSLEARLGEREARLTELGEWGQRLHQVVEARDAAVKELAAKLEELSRWGHEQQGQRIAIEMRLAGLFEWGAKLRSDLETSEAVLGGNPAQTSGMPDDTPLGVHLSHGGVVEWGRWLHEFGGILGEVSARLRSQAADMVVLAAACEHEADREDLTERMERTMVHAQRCEVRASEAEALRDDLARRLAIANEQLRQSQERCAEQAKLIGEKDAIIGRSNVEAARLRSDLVRAGAELERHVSGHGYRLLEAYWKVRDALLPAGSRRRAVGKACTAILRSPIRGLGCLLVGDLQLLGNGLDAAWERRRRDERPHAPRTWLGWAAPFGSRRRMLRDMAAGVLRSPLRLLWSQPLKKWRTAFGLLRRRNVAEMWMRFQQLRGRELHRAAAPAPRAAPSASAPARSEPRQVAAQPIASLPPVRGQIEVSIIIPAHNHWDLTSACLRSIAAHPSATACEVILADDASSDATCRESATVANLVIVRSDTNLGFLRICNLAARQAKGRWICLLNNDTEVRPGWLDELVATAHRDPSVGAVGAKLLFPDGRLQEAGGAVWSDGSATNCGMHTDPDAPEHAYAREADYCSAACLLVERALFTRLGGFDERYAPAFYEDTDLAFRIREAGRKVVYQPRAAVFHHGGASCGAAPGQGIKDHQARNRLVFAERWREVLAGHRPPGSAIHGGSGRLRMVRRMLVIDQRLPTPDRDAGSAFLVAFMRSFLSLGYHVCFVALESGSVAVPAAVALQRLGVEVAGPPYADAASLLARRGGEFDLVAMVRHHVAQRVLGDVTCHAGRAKRIFIPADLHWLRNAREAELTGDAAAAARAQREREEEMRIISASSATVVHSSHERSLILAQSPKSTVALLPWIADHIAASPAARPGRAVSFIGGFAHRPNVDAAIFLATEIWPLVRSRCPDARLSIVGADPPPHVQALACADIRVLGHVPDLVAHLAGVRATIAPLRWGAGFKGKVATSIAQGVPAVVTPVAAEGMDLEERGQILVASDPAGLAAGVIELLCDQALWTRMSASCVALARRRWSDRAARGHLIGLLSRLAALPTIEISDHVRAVALASREEAAHV